MCKNNTEVAALLIPRIQPFELEKGDALIVVDLQNDFLPGGALGVADGEKVLTVINSCIDLFQAHGLPVIATRDWHPPKHCSFQEQGGPWPPHCVADTHGAEFAADLHLPSDATIISKGTDPKKDAYSGFEDTKLEAVLSSLGVRQLFVGGLATDYCVLNTVKDALENCYSVYVLKDAVRAVNLDAEDGDKALDEMRANGAIVIATMDLAA
ncbi:MAG: isochorismatase family protein [Gammaproteobacteria bacterium]|nr:isochorismatase family protein [Gammaproteobacteria bacterium]